MMITEILDRIWDYNPYLGAIVTASLVGALIGTMIGLAIAISSIW